MEPQTTIWPLDEHTRGKHLVLRRYLHAWFPILGLTRGRILFVDGFAGPGTYEGGDPGSPLIALEAFLSHPSRNKMSAQVVFRFIEANQRRADHLKALVEIYRPFPTNCDVAVRCGPFESTMTESLDAIDRDGAQLAPSFVMIDPFGVSGVPLEVIQRIMAHPSCEIYFSFMIEAINRFRVQPEFDRHLDALFGCEDWRSGITMADGPLRKHFFYELYERQLRLAGAKQVIRFELFEGNRLIYAIFFASQSIKGAARMKEAIWKAVKDGSFRFRGARQTAQLSIDLDQPVDFRPLQHALQERFRASDWVDVEYVEDFVSSDQTDFYPAQLREGALKPLERVGLMQVRMTHGTRRGQTYPRGRCQLRFLPSGSG
jgi:three-Cys-motif partner protein